MSTTPSTSPGPWTVDPEWPWCVRGPGKRGHLGPVVVSFGATDTGKAYARLVAAAPEMLALLVEFRDRAFEDTGLDWDNRCRALLASLGEAA